MILSLDRLVWANSADPDQTVLEEQSDQGLHCLLRDLHLLSCGHTGLTDEKLFYPFVSVRIRSLSVSHPVTPFLVR